MDKEALKALGLTDEQVAAVFEDYGKNYVTKVGRIAGSSFCVKLRRAWYNKQDILSCFTFL